MERTSTPSRPQKTTNILGALVVVVTAKDYNLTITDHSTLSLHRSLRRRRRTAARHTKFLSRTTLKPADPPYQQEDQCEANIRASLLVVVHTPSCHCSFDGDGKVNCESNQEKGTENKANGAEEDRNSEGQARSGWH